MSLSTPVFDRGINGLQTLRRKKQFCLIAVPAWRVMLPSPNEARIFCGTHMMSTSTGSFSRRRECHARAMSSQMPVRLPSLSSHLPPDLHREWASTNLASRDTESFLHDEKVTMVRKLPCQTSIEKRLCSPPLRALNGPKVALCTTSITA